MRETAQIGYRAVLKLDITGEMRKYIGPCTIMLNNFGWRVLKDIAHIETNITQQMSLVASAHSLNHTKTQYTEWVP